MMTKYTEIENNYLQRENEDGSVSFIPMDESNSDYQAYLKRDEAEQSTPIVTNEAKTK
jgi:hypothetical protein